MPMYLVREGQNKAFFDQLPRREYAHRFLYKLASAADNLLNSQQNPFYSHIVIATILWCHIVLSRLHYSIIVLVFRLETCFISHRGQHSFFN